MLQRLALFATLGLVLDALGLQAWSAGFWCILGLFIAYGWLVRIEVEQELDEYYKAIRDRIRQAFEQQESEEARDENKPKL